MLSKPIVLIGPMGVGKTTLGRKLAKKLGLPFVDTDVLITNSHGSISDIFAKQGESVFRNYEEEAVESALSTIQVIATGGGAVLSGKTQRLLDQATVIYLSTNGKHMKSRLEKGNRPLLKEGMQDWNRIYEERKPLYIALSDIEIETSDVGLAETISKICEKLDAL
ncbi:MAG: shikimate kinase [Micrococcales bacterium]|nr:shikimate kinase [Actinomycetota bacterium]NCA07194.1 shikimate kinase [Micrococcales bacterium]